MQWMVDSLLDDISEMCCIYAHEVDSHRWGLKHGRYLCKPVGIFPSSLIAYFLHLRWRQTSFFGEEFQPISCIWQVRCRHLSNIDKNCISLISSSRVIYLEKCYKYRFICFNRFLHFYSSQFLLDSYPMYKIW